MQGSYMEYQVRVTSTKNRNVRSAWFRLRRFGLRKDRYGGYAGTVPSRRKLEKLRAYCEQKQLYFRINNAYGKRSGSYRSRFFASHRPVFFGFYFCAYCGKLLPKSKVSVDHLYPVGSASRDPDMQKFLKKKHLSGINDPKNLVPACRRCNQEKGQKMDGWIRKGRIGRHQWVWLLRHLLRIAGIALLTAAAVYVTLYFMGLDVWSLEFVKDLLQC